MIEDPKDSNAFTNKALMIQLYDMYVSGDYFFLFVPKPFLHYFLGRIDRIEDLYFTPNTSLNKSFKRVFFNTGDMLTVLKKEMIPQHELQTLFTGIFTHKKRSIKIVNENDSIPESSYKTLTNFQVLLKTIHKFRLSEINS